MSYQEIFAEIVEETINVEVESWSCNVDSVNSETGTVILTTEDILEDTDHNYVTDAEQTVIKNTSGVNTGDQSDAEIEIAINNQLDGTVVGTSGAQVLTNKTIDGGLY